MESAADLAQAHDFGVLGALKAARLKPSAILKRRASPKIKYNLFRSQLCLLVKLESAADLMQAYKFLKFWELQRRRRSLQLILCNPTNFWSSGSLRGNAFTISPFFENRAHLKIKSQPYFKLESGADLLRAYKFLEFWELAEVARLKPGGERGLKRAASKPPEL
ncbi:hypothetical protein KQX54_003158 [Cotesia glomerata]|uniref:Uncharacterized protein n=1 Tax=Cotesia glomerata TaxID=32391 RepID=A0AAV7IY45_COTGL|nr:hypothetical protein KQX54_003158 [Cotesia glomerata]